MSQHKGTILVGDDDDSVRECISMALETQVYRVVTAMDGQGILQALETERPDLIISDIDMPRLDGFHLSEKIRSRPDLKDIPIIIVSGLTRDSKQTEAVWAHRLGVDIFISKPFDPFQLAAKVDALLARGKE